MRSRFLAATVAALAVGLGACSESTAPVETFEWAGSYDTATKFGGVNGTWRAGATLTLGNDRSVTLSGTVIVNPTVTETGISWTMGDGNGTNANFTFARSSTSTYFWDTVPVNGRLFQGSLQFPGEGPLDFRGRIQ